MPVPQLSTPLDVLVVRLYNQRAEGLLLAALLSCNCT